MWNSEKYLEKLIYRSNTPAYSETKKAVKKLDLVNYSTYNDCKWYIPTAVVTELPENKYLKKCYHVIITWNEKETYPIKDVPSLRKSLFSAIMLDNNVTPILVPPFQIPGNIDEIIVADNISDLPELCCAAFSFKTTTEISEEVSEEVSDHEIFTNDSIYSNDKKIGKKVNMDAYFNDLNKKFMKENPYTQRIIIDEINKLIVDKKLTPATQPNSSKSAQTVNTSDITKELDFNQVG